MLFQIVFIHLALMVPSEMSRLPRVQLLNWALTTERTAPLLFDSEDFAFMMAFKKISFPTLPLGNLTPAQAQRRKHPFWTRFTTVTSQVSVINCGDGGYFGSLPQPHALMSPQKHVCFQCSAIGVPEDWDHLIIPVLFHVCRDLFHIQ